MRDCVMAITCCLLHRKKSGCLTNLSALFERGIHENLKNIELNCVNFFAG